MKEYNLKITREEAKCLLVETLMGQSYLSEDGISVPPVNIGCTVENCPDDCPVYKALIEIIEQEE